VSFIFNDGFSRIMCLVLEMLASIAWHCLVAALVPHIDTNLRCGVIQVPKVGCKKKTHPILSTEIGL